MITTTVTDYRLRELRAEADRARTVREARAARRARSRRRSHR